MDPVFEPESALTFGSRMPAPGDVIDGRYRIEAVVGRGGMSVVYRATHLELDEQVAIKVLSAEAIVLAEYIVRLEREARAVAQIHSEHVVRVHGIGKLEARDGRPGIPYLVMEYLRGLDLAAVLSQRGPLSVDLAIDCIMQACLALEEAHALGIVHRDLKPANLFLTECADGSRCVKVLDFGISRMSRRHGLSSLTDPGTVLGTPSYMAPEQMEAAETVDARSDIWALGTILYELLVGTPPYVGESLPQIFMMIMRSRVPKASLWRGDVPSRVDAAIARCLAVEPQHRFQTVTELARSLSRLGPRARGAGPRAVRPFGEPCRASRSRRTEPPSTVDGVRRRRASSASNRFTRRTVVSLLGGAALTASVSAYTVLTARDDAGYSERLSSVPLRAAALTGASAFVEIPASAPSEADSRARDASLEPALLEQPSQRLAVLTEPVTLAAVPREPKAQTRLSSVASRATRRALTFAGSLEPLSGIDGGIAESAEERAPPRGERSARTDDVVPTLPLDASSAVPPSEESPSLFDDID